MKMFKMSIDDLDGMYVSDLIDTLEDIFLLDPKAKLTIEENEWWDSLANKTYTYYELVCLHKDERGQ